MRRPGDNRTLRELLSAERARSYGPLEVWVQRAVVVFAPIVAYLVTRDWRLPALFLAAWLLMFVVGPKHKSRQLLGLRSKERQSDGR